MKKEPLNLTVTPRFNAVRAAQMQFGDRKFTEAIFHDALQELYMNGRDAGATKINLEISKPQNVCRMVDDGRGFNDLQRQGFFWVYDSEKREHPTKAYAGLHGTGRIRTLRFADLLVYSVPQDLGGRQCVRVKLTWDDVQKYAAGDATPRDWERVRTPEWWPHPSGQTGSVVCLIPTHPNFWEKVPTQKPIQDEMGLRFSPMDVGHFSVNDRPLTPRALVSGTSLLTRTFTVEELGRLLSPDTAGKLGICQIGLYMPAKIVRPKDDVVWLGARLQTCRLEQFLNELPDPRQRRQVPALLLMNTVIGDVFIEALNRFTHENRKEFLATLYEEMHLAVLEFLACVVGPIVAEEFAHQDTARQREAKQTMLRDFSRDVAAVFGTDPVSLDDIDMAPPLPSDEPGVEKPKGPPPVHPPLELDCRRIRPMVGELNEITVVRHEGIDPTDLEWNATGIQEIGDVKITSTLSVSFVGQVVGRGILAVFNRKKPLQRAEVDITVVAEKGLAISPAETQIPQGCSRRFRARNTGTTSGQLRWDVQPRQEVVLSTRQGEQVIVEVSPDCPLGTYTLSITDVQNTGVNAQATFEVTRSYDVVTIKLGNQVYVLRKGDSKQQRPVVLTQRFRFARRGKKDVGLIEVNLDHADFRYLGNLTSDAQARHLLILDSVVVEHLHAELKAGRIEHSTELAQKYHDLRGQYLETRAKAKQQKKKKSS